MRSKKGPDPQHWQSAGSFWFFSSFCFSLENYIASFRKTRRNKFDSFPYKLLKKYLVLIFCRSKIVSKKDTICRNITFNKLKNCILLTTLTSSPHFSASDGLSILTRGIPSASRIWSTPCTIYSVTPCTIYGVTPCTVYGNTLHNLQCNTLHTWHWNTLHNLQCNTLHNLQSDTLHNLQCNMLHNLPCNTLHTLQCNTLHNLQCNILFTVRLVWNTLDNLLDNSNLAPKYPTWNRYFIWCKPSITFNRSSKYFATVILSYSYGYTTILSYSYGYTKL